MSLPVITNVTFARLEEPTRHGETIRMEIHSATPLMRALGVVVKVGNQEARVAGFSPVDGSLAAFLKEEPPDGAPVFVGWEDGIAETDFTYSPPLVA